MAMWAGAGLAFVTAVGLLAEFRDLERSAPASMMRRIPSRDLRHGH